MIDSPASKHDGVRPADGTSLRQHPVAGEFVRANFGDERELLGLQTAQSAAWITQGWDPPHHAWLYVVGVDDEAIDLVRALIDEQPDVVGITVSRDLVPALPPALVPSGDPWDWWSTRSAPPTYPGEHAVSYDDGTDQHLAERIQRLLDVASPDHWAPPGHPRVKQWAVLLDEDSGEAISCAADTRPGGAPHLASVATHPDHRGHGHARTVVAALTRRLFSSGASTVTLGMHAENDVARRVYSDLGFEVRYAWLSSRFPHPLTP